MLTKSEFLEAALADIDNYPTLAALYQAGDPRIIQHLGAMATMLAMLSAQIDAAQAEAFDKSRDATVLADAAMRGIIPKATPLRVRVLASNGGTSAFVVESGRVIIDSSGRPFLIQTSATVPAGGAATFEALQVERETITHTASDVTPFYAIEVPASDDGAFLAAIGVSDANGELTYSQRYTGIEPGERVFHVEADDRQRVYVRLGYEGIVGVQPANGDTITLTVSRSFGNVSVESGSPFSFEYLSNPNESYIELSMDATLIAGADPISTDTLRELAKYPSVYDDQAVFLGQFDFLVRRNFPDLQFLSVWNETAEEKARSASSFNINRLFVACLSATGDEATVSEPDYLNPVPPTRISEANLTSTQKEIRAKIIAADDSYAISFYTPVLSEIPVTITATVSSSYVASSVRQNIIDALLAAYGKKAAAAKRGRNRPLYRDVYNLLKSSVPALSVGSSDLQVSITTPDTIIVRPEMWRYVSAESLTVTVTTENVATKAWGV